MDNADGSSREEDVLVQKDVVGHPRNFKEVEKVNKQVVLLNDNNDGDSFDDLFFIKSYFEEF